MPDEKTDALRDIFIDVAGEATFTEPQEEGPSRDPIGKEEAAIVAEVSQSTRENGLEEAVDSDFGGAANA